MRRENFTARDGKTLSLAVWDEVPAPIGVVQILHGMSEHVARYDEFAQALNKAGFIAFGDDHRSHGQTDPDRLGLVGEGNLFEQTVADARQLSDWARNKYGVPVILFGHSYGSFLAQRYLTYGSGCLDGVVLSGCAFMSGFPVKTSVWLTKGCLKPKKKDLPGVKFARMTFESYDKKIKEGKDAWLNRDEQEVAAYQADPLCGFTCSNGFYHYFSRGMLSIARSPHNGLNRNLPMLLIAGDKDMVGACGKLVKALKIRYEKLGLSPKMILYPGARHEILKEINRTQVFDDVINFLRTCLR